MTPNKTLLPKLFINFLATFWKNYFPLIRRNFPVLFCKLVGVLSNKLFCLAIFFLSILLVETYLLNLEVFLEDDQYSSYLLGKYCGIEFKEFDVLPGEDPKPDSYAPSFCDPGLKINYFYPFYTMFSEPGLQNLAIAYRPSEEGSRQFLTRCQDFYEGLTFFNELRPMDGWLADRANCGKEWTSFLKVGKNLTTFRYLPDNIQTAVLELVARVVLIDSVAYMDMLGIYPVKRYMHFEPIGKPFLHFGKNWLNYMNGCDTEAPLNIMLWEIMHMEKRLKTLFPSMFEVKDPSLSSTWSKIKKKTLIHTSMYIKNNLRGDLPDPLTSKDHPLNFVKFYLHFLRNSVGGRFFISSLYLDDPIQTVKWWKRQPELCHTLLMSRAYEKNIQLLSSLGKIVMDHKQKSDDNLDLSIFPKSLGLKRVNGEIELIIPRSGEDQEEPANTTTTTGPTKKTKVANPWYSYILPRSSATAAAVLLPTVTVTAFLALKLITKISRYGL